MSMNISCSAQYANKVKLEQKTGRGGGGGGMTRQKGVGGHISWGKNIADQTKSDTNSSRSHQNTTGLNPRLQHKQETKITGRHKVFAVYGRLSRAWPPIQACTLFVSLGQFGRKLYVGFGGVRGRG